MEKVLFKIDKPVRLIVCLLLSLFLVACQTTATKKSPINPSTLSQQQAEQWLVKADNSASPEKEYHQLQAAHIFFEIKAFDRTQAVLNRLNVSQLGVGKFADFSLLAMKLANVDGDYYKVRELGFSEKLLSLWSKLSVSQQQEILSQRADALLVLGDDLNALQDYFRLAQLLQTPEDKVSAHNNLWLLANNLSFSQLEQLAAKEGDKVLAGWYQLALAYRKQSGNIRQQMALFSQWRLANPSHPGAIYPPSTLSGLQQLAPAPKHVALLLPTSGPLAQAGKAIQAGFLAAWFAEQEQFGNSPKISFFDTGANADITAVYQSALVGGADMIIGPLDKAKVAQLNSLESLAVNTIALNYLEVDQQPQASLVQMGLSVSDEAKQVVNRAWLEGHRHAMVISPEARWAEKAVEAFNNGWLERGGKLDMLPAYGASSQDFSNALGEALHIEQSKQRRDRLVRILGKPLEFTPRRRQDVDMVFMVGYPNQARQIKPTINFWYASDLSVYATSHIYSGEEDRGRNGDLNGVKFAAMPWTMDGFLAEHLQPDETVIPSFRQLYALGLDAYQLHQWLGQLKSVPSATLSGATGVIHLDDLGIVSRVHPWAEFKRGRVVPVSSISGP